MSTWLMADNAMTMSSVLPPFLKQLYDILVTVKTEESELLELLPSESRSR